MDNNLGKCDISPAFSFYNLGRRFLKLRDLGEDKINKFLGKSSLVRFDFDLRQHKLRFKKGNVKDLPGFAINGPMYNTPRVNREGKCDLKPYGGFYYGELDLWITEFIKQDDPLMKQAEELNFNLRGSGGVFILGNDNTVGITSNKKFEDGGMKTKDTQLIFQNGPLLVENGVVSEQFRNKGENKYKRLAIGYEKPGETKVAFVYSREPQTLQDFASLCANEIGLRDVLYLDGGPGGAAYSKSGVVGAHATRLDEGAFKINII